MMCILLPAVSLDLALFDRLEICNILISHKFLSIAATSVATKRRWAEDILRTPAMAHGTHKYACLFDDSARCEQSAYPMRFHSICRQARRKMGVRSAGLTDSDG
jgi:hypothetical protein